MGVGEMGIPLGLMSSTYLATKSLREIKKITSKMGSMLDLSSSKVGSHPGSYNGLNKESGR